MAAEHGSTTRRYDLDWLRVFAILTVFAFHSAHFFDVEDWSVKSPTTYASLTQWQAFLVQWMMPLIFVISGAALWYAVRKGGFGRYLRDKTLRLLVPVAVAVFSHAALQVYLERLSHGQFRGSFFEFLPHYFDGVYIPGTTGNFAFHGMHLWYLEVLFLFSVFLAPLLFWLRRGRGSVALSKVADVLALPGGILLLMVPTIVMQNVLTNDTALGGFRIGGWNMPQYLWFLVAGFVVISDERIQRRIIQARYLALGLGAALSLALLASGVDVNSYPDLASWLWIVAILGLGMKHLTRRTPLLDYAGEAVMPFYVLHQSVLLVVGYFVLQWGLPDPASYLVIAVGSFSAIVLTYELLIRRNDPVRVLFGMHPQRRATRKAEASSTALAGVAR